MKASIEFGGAVFNERTNWKDLVRHPYGFLTGPGERDLDAASALGALAEALKGTQLEAGLADAALEVIEQGDARTMESVVAAGWERAPNAIDRILSLVERIPNALSDAWLSRCFGALLRLAPSDTRVLAALENKAQGANGYRLLEDAARYNPQWLADRLAVLRPSTAADFATWIFVAGVPEAGSSAATNVDRETARRYLLDAVAKLGEPYRAALLAQYNEVANRFPGTAKHRCLQQAFAGNSALSAAVAH
jgi:hypothetical protein